MAFTNYHLDQAEALVGQHPALDLLRRASRTVWEVHSNADEVLGLLASQTTWWATKNTDGDIELAPEDYGVSSAMEGLVPLLDVADDSDNDVLWSYGPVYVYVDSENLDVLLNWIKKNKVRVNPSSIEILQDDLRKKKDQLLEELAFLTKVDDLGKGP